MATILGHYRLNTKRLDEIAAHLGKNNDDTLHAIAKRVEARAKMLCPRDPQRMPLDPSQPVTGALRNGIEAEKIREGLYWVHDSVEYGIYQELGTSRGLPPRPFMIPALEIETDRIDADFEKGLFK